MAIFAENSPRWLICDQGIMRLGAADAVRGTSAPIEELKYILEDSGAIGLVVQNQDLLEELSLTMEDASICGLGQAAPNPLRSVIKYFPHEV